MWVVFCYFVSCFSKESRSKWVFGKQKKISQIPILLHFCTGNEFRDFCERACYYDVTEAKPWDDGTWYECLEDTLR